MKNINEVIQLIKNSKKTLWIFCGLPYSGKTHAAKKIMEKTSCVYVSIDEILKERGYDWNTNSLPGKEEWDRIFNTSYRMAEQTLKSGENVLYDSTNHTRASRDVLRRVARDVGANANVIYVKTPVEIVRRRWEENKKTKSRFVLNEKLLNETIDALEVPSDDEGVVILKGNQ